MGQRLVRKASTDFVTTLEIVCDHCESKHENMRQEILYLERKIKEMTIHNDGDKMERRRLMKKIMLTQSTHLSLLLKS